MNYTDTELLDFLQKLNDRNNYTGKCVLRESWSGRGWRLHESNMESAEYNVRKAITNYMKIYGKE